MNQIYRPRRLRRSENIRGLVRETCLRAEEFIYPMFVMEGQGMREPIDSMPGQHRFSVDELVRECEGLAPLGIGAVNLFGYCEDKAKPQLKAHEVNVKLRATQGESLGEHLSNNEKDKQKPRIVWPIVAAWAAGCTCSAC